MSAEATIQTVFGPLFSLLLGAGVLALIIGLAIILAAQLAESPRMRKRGRKVAAYGGTLLFGAVLLYFVLPALGRVIDGAFSNPMGSA